GAWRACAARAIPCPVVRQGCTANCGAIHDEVDRAADIALASGQRAVAMRRGELAPRAVAVREPDRFTIGHAKCAHARAVVVAQQPVRDLLLPLDIAATRRRALGPWLSVDDDA